MAASAFRKTAGPKFLPDYLMDKDLKLDPYGTQLPKTTTTTNPAAKQLAAVTGKPMEMTTTYTKPVTPAPSVAPVDQKPLTQMEPKVAAIPPAQPPASAPTQPAGAPIAIQPRAMSQQVQNVLSMLEAKIKAAPITADQIMQSQEYLGQAGAIDKMATYDTGVALANARRALAGRNMLRSTPAVQALAGVEGDISLKASAQKAALIPQMLTTAYNRQQADLKNTAELLGTISGLETDAFTRGVTEFNATAPYNMLTKGQDLNQKNYEAEQADAKAAAEAKAKADAENAMYEGAWKEAEQTGVYYDPAARQLASRLVALKEEATKLAQSGDVAGSNKISQEQAQPIRDQLKGMGIDADALFGANVTAADARKNIGLLGQWTLEGRKKEWELTGVDPVTGVANPEFILKDMQARKYLADAKVAEIEAQIAADPVYGASAKAKADLAKAEKEVEKANADIAATYALANERTQNAANARANPKETDAEKRAREAAEKRRNDTITSTRRDYPLASQGAAEIWADAMMYGGTPNDNGSLPTIEEVGQFIDDMIAQTPGLLPTDADFLRTYLWATQGQKWATERLTEWKEE